MIKTPKNLTKNCYFSDKQQAVMKCLQKSVTAFAHRAMRAGGLTPAGFDFVRLLI
jgi:hypothetical protein